MSPKEFEVAGKVVLVTGAGRGIGSGIAEVLAEAGATIALNALTPTYADETARSIRDRASTTPGTVEVFAGDVTQTEGAESIVAQVMQRFGRIDVLVNNLGDAVMEPLVTLPDTSSGTAPRTLDDERLQRILDLNLMATLRCTRAVGAHFLARRSGKVINISSYTVARSGGRVVIYTAAKAAVVGFTQAQALEWASYNVQVNAIAPGLFPDPRSHGEAGAKTGEQIAARLAPVGRAGRLREVGLLTLYLASAASDYMTGQTLYLDGGASIR